MTDRPGYTADQLLRGLSLPRRIGYVLAGLAGLAGASMLGLLWATEPTPLPGRTRLAFAGLIAVGLAWAALATWALARRPLFAADRIIGASLALGFSVLTTIAAVAVAFARSSVAGVVTAAGVGVALTITAAVMFIRARRYRAALLDRQHRIHH